MQKQLIAKISSALLIVMLALAALPVTQAYAAANACTAAVTDWRSFTTGNWNAPGTWECQIGGTWFQSSSGTPSAITNIPITILTTHTVTVTVATSADTVTINAGGKVTVNNVTWTISNGTIANDLIVNGTLELTGAAGVITPTGAISFGAGSTYTHNRNGGIIPTATWNATSTLEVTGNTTTSPTGDGQAFGNVTWNSASQTGTRTITPASIAGNFLISSTGTGQLNISKVTLAIGGNYTQSGATTSVRIGSGTARTWNVAGSVSITGGTLIMSDGTATGTINVAGNFSHTGGTITETDTTTGTGAIKFTSTGSFTSGGTVSNTIDFTVNSGATLNMGTSTMTGNSFTLANGGTLGVGSIDGITVAGATGNIQVTGTRTYTTGANYVYNGTSAQVTGNGLTQNTPVNLDINNTAGVTLSAATTISGNLTIGSGATLSTSGSNFNMTVGGNWTNNGGTFTPGTNTVTFNGTGAQAINGTASSQTFNNVTLTKTAGQTLSVGGSTTTLTVNDLTETTGNFTAPATLNVNGNLTLTAGTFTAGATTNVTGNFTHTTGNTFTAGTNAVVLNGTAQAVGGTAATAFYDLTISGASGVKTLPANTTITHTLSIAPSGNSTASLNTGTTYTVPNLTLGGVGTASGSWGSTTSAATHQTNTYFAATTGMISATNNTVPTYTLTYTAGANGTISGTTPQTVTHGANGTLVTAVPNTGYHFTSWSDGVLTAARTDLNVTANASVTASFAINTYTLTYTAGANGTLSGTTPQTVNHGSNGTLVTAVPDTGYHFTSWSDGVLTAARTDLNVTADVSVTASFAINTYTLTYTAGANGTLSGTTPQTVNHGANGTLVTAVPDANYHFTSWSDGVLTAARTDLNVTADVSVTASFAIDTYTLTYTAGANGTLSGTTPQTVNHASNGTLVTAVPDAGYHFTSWSDGVLTAARTDLNVTADVTVTASFAINAYTLTYTAGANGTLSGTTPQTVNHGSNGTLVTAAPDTGYHFTSWSDGVLTAARTDLNVTADVSVTASFAINTYTLTYTAGANGTLSGTTPQTVNHGANGTLVTAVPDAGYHFTSWSDGVLTAARTDLNVTATVSVTASFATGTTPTITFGAAPTPTYLGGNFTVSASTTNTDSSALTYSYVSGPCAFVSGATFSSSGAGNCVVQAAGIATTNFNAASQTQNVAIGKATPTLSVTNSPVIYNGAPQAAIVVGTVAGTVSNITYAGLATVPTNAGTYAITADFAPTDSANYNNLTGASAGNFVINPSGGGGGGGNLPRFGDVPFDYWAWKYIEAIYAAGITSGCSTQPMMYCPTEPVTRAEMAVFLVRGIRSYPPPPATGAVFTDVPANYWAANWIEQLALEGITGGCGNGNYCPDALITRAEMAIFLLRTKHGGNYVPPTATGTAFTDVPTDYWAANWIEQLALEGVTGGCGGGNFCPDTNVTRDQMAVFLQRLFNFPLN